MSPRVVQVNCVIDPLGREPDALLEAWPTIHAVARAAARAGAAVTVLQASHRAAEFRRDGVSYRFVGEARGYGKGGAMPWRLARAARQSGPQAIHLNGFDFPFHARALCGSGAPVLVQDHASRPARRTRMLQRWGHARIAAAAFTATEQAQPFRAAGVLPKNAPTIAVPESSSDFTPGDREEARAVTGVFGSPALLWVGRLDANKDPLTLLAALRGLLATFPDLHLWCAFGASDLLPEIETLCLREPALAARVHLLGNVPHHKVESLCRACDLFVLASRSEGSGYALIEALACGLPAVVTDIPSFHALTCGGAVGTLVPVGDVDSLAHAIVRATTAGSVSRATVRAHFERHLSFDAVGRSLVETYAALAAGAVS